MIRTPGDAMLAAIAYLIETGAFGVGAGRFQLDVKPGGNEGRPARAETFEDVYEDRGGEG